MRKKYWALQVVRINGCDFINSQRDSFDVLFLWIGITCEDDLEFHWAKDTSWRLFQQGQIL